MGPQIILSLIAILSVSICRGQKDSPELQKFRECLESKNYQENTNAYVVCAESKVPQLKTLCTTLAKDYSSGPFCLDETMSNVPNACSSTDFGKKALEELKTRFLIMQLGVCIQEFKLGQKRLTAILLKQQGYDYPSLKPLTSQSTYQNY